MIAPVEKGIGRISFPRRLLSPERRSKLLVLRRKDFEMTDRFANARFIDLEEAADIRCVLFSAVCN